MNWIKLEDAAQLNEIKELSKTRAQVIFKHSTRCSVSSMAKNRLEKDEQPPAADFYYLDLIQFRSLSDQVATDFSVHHESPQVLLIKDAECIYEESHNGIQLADIMEQLNVN